VDTTARSGTTSPVSTTWADTKDIANTRSVTVLSNTSTSLSTPWSVNNCIKGDAIANQTKEANHLLVANT